MRLHSVLLCEGRSGHGDATRRRRFNLLYAAVPSALRSFQPRLSIIPGTLALALPDLLHFAVVVLTCVVMFASAAALTYGPGVSQLSSPGSAVYLMLRYVLLRNDDFVFRVRLCGPCSSVIVRWCMWFLRWMLWAFARGLCGAAVCSCGLAQRLKLPPHLDAA